VASAVSSACRSAIYSLALATAACRVRFAATSGRSITAHSAKFTDKMAHLWGATIKVENRRTSVTAMVRADESPNHRLVARRPLRIAPSTSTATNQGDFGTEGQKLPNLSLNLYLALGAKLKLL
jgi:hypothetical protein